MPDCAGIMRLAAGHHERLGRAALAGRDLTHCSPGSNRLVLGEQSIPFALTLIAVSVFDQQPIIALAVRAVIAHAHEHPASAQFLAGEGEFELTLAECLIDIAIALRHPETPIPQHDRAAAIFAFGYGPLEVTVVQRVVFHFDSQALVGGIERGSFGYRPGFEDAVVLQPQIVVEATGRVFLDDKARVLNLADRGLSARLSRLGKVAFRPVLSKVCLCHYGYLSSTLTRA